MGDRSGLGKHLPSERITLVPELMNARLRKRCAHVEHGRDQRIRRFEWPSGRQIRVPVYRRNTVGTYRRTR